MPQFTVAVESSVSNIYQKTFNAGSMDEAVRMAEAEPWEGDQAKGWERIDGNTFAEVREDLCKEEQ